MPQIKANGVMLEYDVAGSESGIPFLMIQGFGTQMTGWPAEYRDAMVAAGMRVIRFDNRDVGLSQKWHGIIPNMKDVGAAVAAGKRPDVPYTLADMAADAASLLDVLGIESAHISGASMGGMIAQMVALSHPEKTRSLISIFSTTSDPSLPRSTPEATEALMSRPSSSDRDAVIAHSLKGRRTYASTRWPFDEQRLAKLIGASFDRSFYPEGTTRQFAAIMASPPRTERLKSLKVPALVLHGTADTLIPCEAGRHTAACIADAEHHELEGWGHDLPLEVIPILLDLIVPFVRKVETARAERMAAQ